MKFEIDDKDIAKEIAERAESCIYDYLSREDYRNLWYNREIADALNFGISQIVADNKDKIIKEIIDKAAERLCKNITFSAVIAALGEQK